MARLGLETEIVDRAVYERAVGHFRAAGIVLPTFGELAAPSTQSSSVTERLESLDPDAAEPGNLFRVNWYNDAQRSGRVDVPDYVEIPSELTGVDARIILALGNRFPMIRAHKVLAAYGCLAPRIITGQFDPTVHRAVWPSTGNYCRGGVAISRIMGCHGVAVLPEGMSKERFDWLDQWVAHPDDIIRTPGSESNVKEIYDACARLDQDPDQIIFNQFCEFGNHLVHRLCTGQALETVFEEIRAGSPSSRLRAFVSATGSAGTIAAGDHLKEIYGTRIVAMEALECPTLLYNGFGEHNIQGIGDKHIPYIHNVMNTDLVVGVSDTSTDTLDVLFNTNAGRSYLSSRRGLRDDQVHALADLGYSSIGNLLAAIKVAKYYNMGSDDVIITVATDGAEMYTSGREALIERYFDRQFDLVCAGETWGRALGGAGTDHVMELSQRDKERMFNLGYFTWVEQQGIEVEDFVARRSEDFWSKLQDLVPAWDAMIASFNAEVGLNE
jgi:cysteine synthase